CPPSPRTPGSSTRTANTAPPTRSATGCAPQPTSSPTHGPASAPKPRPPTHGSSSTISMVTSPAGWSTCATSSYSPPTSSLNSSSLRERESSEPGMESRAVSAVDSEDGARHVRRLGAGEEGDTGGDLLRAAEATHGDGGEEPRRSGAVGGVHVGVHN